MDIIRDLLSLWVIGAVSGTAYIIYALFVRSERPVPGTTRGQQQVTTRRTPVGPPPVARPSGAPQGSAAPARTSSAGAGSPEHQSRGAAPTRKLPASDPATDRVVKPSADDAAATDLFSGLAAARAKADAAPPVAAPEPAGPKAPPKDDHDKAGRIEEYGFHVGQKAADAPVVTEPAAAPRTQTQELDDILKRIDAVLSETDAPPAEATLVNQQSSGSSSGQATLPVPTVPPTEKLDRKSTDPNQQKLF